MSELEIKLDLPLDGSYLRRECPLCRRQFKIRLTEEELHQFEAEAVDSFLLEKLLESAEEQGVGAQASTVGTCPYCGQQAPLEEWWTQEQVDYIRGVVENLLVDLVNQRLIQPLRRSLRAGSGSSISLKVELKELKGQTVWIAPECDDMEEVALPCCSRAVKVDPAWLGRPPKVVHCFFCGYPHAMSAGEG